MTAEQIHDALTLLPSDLAAEADRYRSRPSRTPSWQRWAAMAACFALVLLAGSFWMTGLSGEKTSAAFTAESAMDQAQAPAAMAPAPMFPPDEEPAEEIPAQAPGTGSAPESSGCFAASSLPRLTLADGEGTQVFQPRGIQWVHTLPEGTSVGTQADVSAPTDHPETLDVLILTGSGLELLWETQPLSVAIACWQLQNGVWLPAALSGEEALTFPAGESVCQVTACWEEGTISYAFRVSRPE